MSLYGLGTTIGAGIFALSGKVAGEAGVLALGFPIEGLAATTSGITLAIFAMVKLAFRRLKARTPAPENMFQIPRWIPAGGFFVSVGFLLFAVVLWFRP